MFKIFKLYKQSQEAQLRWIKTHPFQYIALNTILLIGFIWYVEKKHPLQITELEVEDETIQS